jgi:dihydroorotate dehydrogenase
MASAGARAVVIARAEVPMVRPVSAMGLEFGNPLGLAAGYDRTGGLLAALAPLGFGHIEVGTVTPGTAGVSLSTTAGGKLRIGVSIGSARMGICQQVIDDYVAALSRVWGRADYVVANLSSPFAARGGDTPGVEELLRQLGATWHALFAETGLRPPLLIKVALAGAADLPGAITAARDLALSGVVLVSASLRQISAVREHLDGGAVISVGGVASAADVRDRMSAGASLVQIYTTFVREGPGVVRRILADLEVLQP